MKKFYLVEIDNNLSYEDHNICNEYFESYVDAFNYVSDETYDIVVEHGDEPECYNDYRIYVIDFEISREPKLLSAWVMGEWNHGEDAYVASGFETVAKSWNFEESRWMTPSEKCFYDWNQHYIHKHSPLYKAWNCIDKHNEELVEEFVGYREFCKHTLSNYIDNEIETIYGIIKDCNITSKHLLQLYNTIDCLKIKQHMI